MKFSSRFSSMSLCWDFLVGIGEPNNSCICRSAERNTSYDSFGTLQQNINISSFIKKFIEMTHFLVGVWQIEELLVLVGAGLLACSRPSLVRPGEYFSLVVARSVFTSGALY